ncbi:unnamed protein product, partial [marine sediment metagenome]
MKKSDKPEEIKEIILESGIKVKPINRIEGPTGKIQVPRPMYSFKI